MTKVEQAELAELNLTREQLAQKTEAITRVIAKPPDIILRDTSQQEPQRTRKPRSDKGVPRESFYLNVPAVRWDMSMAAGREEFNDWLAGVVEGDERLRRVVEQLLAEIDRLRGK
jgi:hypothetical protein